MTEKCESKWSPTEDQINNIIIPAMQRTAQQYAKYASEIQWPPTFIALVLRDIADTFKENSIAVEKILIVIKSTSIRLLIKSQLVNFSVIPLKTFLETFLICN